MYEKKFDEWNIKKKELNHVESRVNIRSGEIRWMAFGVNVGSEIDGKGESFTRPGLIISVVGSHFALVTPMSTKVKDVSGYIPFDWKDKKTALCIHQVRIISQKRILRRIGRISENKLKIYKEEIKNFFDL